jgi:hypothetical protein
MHSTTPAAPATNENFMTNPYDQRPSMKAAERERSMGDPYGAPYGVDGSGPGRGSALIDEQGSRLGGVRDRLDVLEMTGDYGPAECCDRQAVAKRSEQAAQLARIGSAVSLVMLLRQLRRSVRGKMRSTELLGENQQQSQ